ncbi:MAG: 50S ribosomal protein L3 [Candidatus Pacebacteria bacterium]|jgi:large subunit ribosomal protein L3|nr:50S ribosomal protein L3 [Candidatus Paceibacterota bacterium]
MKFILGKKLNMVQYFTPEGRAVPATLVDAGPMTLVQVKNSETDGYTALQFGYGPQKKERLSKALSGHMKELGLFAILKEVRVEDAAHGMKQGDTVDVSIFTIGDAVDVAAVSKAKGFQGVVKRYNFKGGPRSHGQKHSEREPGSIGGGLRTRVPKGMRMAGRTGGVRKTVGNLKIVDIDTDNNQLLIKGAIPGRRGTLVEIFG